MPKPNRCFRCAMFLIGIFYLGGCADTESWAGHHQSAQQSYRQEGENLEKEAIRKEEISEYLKAASLFSDAARDRLRSAKEATLLGNIVKTKKEYQEAAHDFIKASDDSLRAEGIAIRAQ